jgi:transcriptional adapter 2-alpha
MLICHRLENDLTTLLQTQAKANMSRDYYSSERLSQLRTVGGRQSSVPDSRRAHSLAGDSDVRKSHERELSPKPHTAGTSASAIRKPRMFQVLLISQLSRI